MLMPPRPPPRSSNRHAERRSYLEARTYIRPRVHAISRSCLHLHAAVIIRPGLHEGRDAFVYRSSRWGPAAEKTGPGIDLSRSLFNPSPAGPSSRRLSFSFLGSAPATTDQRVFNYPDKIASRSLERWWPFILIHAGDLEH